MCSCLLLTDVKTQPTVHQLSDKGSDQDSVVFMWFCCAGQQQRGLVVVDADLLELKRGNLLLEREKLSLEIQILRGKLARKTLGDEV